MTVNDRFGFGRRGKLNLCALNRDGDCLSDLVLPLFGSIAGAESLLLGFGDDPLVPSVVMAEAPHGTAPSLEGKNVANPMAMILAAAALLGVREVPAIVIEQSAIQAPASVFLGEQALEQAAAEMRQAAAEKRHGSAEGLAR